MSRGNLFTNFPYLMDYNPNYNSIFPNSRKCMYNKD